MPTQPGTHPLDRLQPRKSVQPSQAQEQRTHFRVTSGRTTTPTVPPHPSRSNVAGTFKLASEQESRPVHAGVSRSSKAHSRTCVASSVLHRHALDFRAAAGPFAAELGPLDERLEAEASAIPAIEPRYQAPFLGAHARTVVRSCSYGCKDKALEAAPGCHRRGMLRRAPPRRPVHACVPTAHRIIMAKAAPFFLEDLVLSAEQLDPNGSRGEFAPRPTPSNRRRCIRSTASMARGQPTDRCGPCRRPRG